MTHNAEKDTPAECGWCGEERTIVYVDVLDIPWCRACYDDTFLENFTPDPARVLPPAVDPTDTQEQQT